MSRLIKSKGYIRILSANEKLLLSILQTNTGKSSQRYLQHLLGLTKQNLSRMIKDLKYFGLIKSEINDTDNRVKLISLSSRISKSIDFQNDNVYVEVY